MKYNMNISPVDDCVWLNEGCTLLIDGDTPEEAANAAQALNDSCRLTEENARLRELVEFAFNEGAEEGFHGGGYFSISKSQQLLNQLKDKNNDK